MESKNTIPFKISKGKRPQKTYNTRKISKVCKTEETKTSQSPISDESTFAKHPLPEKLLPQQVIEGIQFGNDFKPKLTGEGTKQRIQRDTSAHQVMKGIFS